nr:MAG TPA: papain-like amidase [Bacteriophage sp.]
MRKILLLLTLIMSTACFADCSEWKEGDIVFQISKSKQSPFIQLATGSLYSHCGIVVKNHGHFYVLEASNVVKLTPLATWIDRGRFSHCIVRTVFNYPIKVSYKKYLGQKYDTAFKFNNGKMYCSELVYEIYKNQFGIELCKPRKVSEYHTLGLTKLLKKRGINKNQLVVAPSDLLNSKYCK